jgi:23S rRNA pseudouridine1911/1915/1917 synthase
MDSPYLLEETGDFAVVFKPAKMHCTPKDDSFHRKGTQGQTKKDDSNTLIDWYTAHFPPAFEIMHRLDYETHGLLLFAKNEKSFNFFRNLQDEDGFAKEYSAVCIPAGSAVQIAGFPLHPLHFQPEDSMSFQNYIIESYFRPYGPGRKLVRPVTDLAGSKHKEKATDKGRFYKTEIISVKDDVFTVQIKRGFRHQIRCHLCWIGYPILNDPLYSHGEASAPSGGLALRSHALFFADPASGRKKEYRIESLSVLRS